MKNNTFLIRFIDIGLIILFGFIVISDITVRSQIELPGSDPSSSDEEREMRLFVVNVDPDDEYRLSDFNTSEQYGAYSSQEELHQALVNLNEQIRQDGESPVALIEPDDSISMQRLIDVLDLFDKLGIPKNINVESLRL